MEPSENKPSKKKPERPLECSECKRPITVIYTEIVGDLMTQTSMCSECPELQRRLKGTAHEFKSNQEGVAGVACGNCGTTLEAVKMGSSLGCQNCYEIFGDIILTELKESNHIPARLVITNKSTPVHIGRIPGETLEIAPSLRLLALNEALNETLKREDYEQAAILRDQIKELTESETNHDTRKKRKSNS